MAHGRIKEGVVSKPQLYDKAYYRCISIYLDVSASSGMVESVVWADSIANVKPK
jgi:hypothetical protein